MRQVFCVEVFITMEPVDGQTKRIQKDADIIIEERLKNSLTGAYELATKDLAKVVDIRVRGR